MRRSSFPRTYDPGNEVAGNIGAYSRRDGSIVPEDVVRPLVVPHDPYGLILLCDGPVRPRRR
ncbi:hypothetical protein FAIPA1_80175 [Frankia sp. AiPs1]